jgi:hypothetical protein
MRVVSDAAGHFVLHDLPKGSYTITASKPGYVDAAVGRRSPTDTGNQSLVLSDGERRGDVTLPFWRFGAIVGTVVDEVGEPVIGIQVRAFRRAIVSGRMKFSPLGNTYATDDRGIYRLASLPPGDYVVGIVTTQTTVPVSIQSAYAAASTAGTSQDFRASSIDRRFCGSFPSIGGTCYSVHGSCRRRSATRVRQWPPIQEKVPIRRCSNRARADSRRRRS